MDIVKSNGGWGIYNKYLEEFTENNLTTEEIAGIFAKEAEYEGKYKAIEIMLTFPSGQVVNGERVPLRGNGANEQGINDMTKWIEVLRKLETDEEYYAEIDRKLNELKGTN